MARLIYMIENLESPILILHQESTYSQWNVFYLQWKVFNFEKLVFEINKQTQLIEQRIEWKAIIITLIKIGNLSLIYKVPIWISF